MSRKIVSIVIPCFNERENIGRLIEAVDAVFKERLDHLDHEFVISDNKSTDGTRDVLMSLSARRKSIKVLYNDKNYIQGFSLNNAILNASGDAVIIMYADFQDPPELIPDLVAQWEGGRKVVPLVRVASREGMLMYNARRLFYLILKITSGLQIIPNYSGTGCYDKSFVDLCKKNMSHLFAMRLFVAKHGYDIGRVEFIQPARAGGRSKFSLKSLIYDASEIISQNYSKRAPLYILALSFLGGVLALVVGAVVLGRKLLFWDQVSSGIAPLLLMLLFSLFVQSFLHAQTWVQLNRLEAFAYPDTPKLAQGRGEVLEWGVERAKRLSGLVERTAVFMPVFGYAGILLTAVVSATYLIYKLVSWDQFSLGVVPSILLVCLSVALQLTVGGVLMQNLQRSLWMLTVRNQPLVRVERRDNFGDEVSGGVGASEADSDASGVASADRSRAS